MTVLAPKLELAPKLALAALILALPIGFGLRMSERGPDSPLPHRPLWAHLVVITVGAVPSDLDTSHRALLELARRAAGVERMYAPSRSSAASAVSLWTGRWPMAHGVVSNDLRLPRGAWTLAKSARASGAATAAYLEEPFVTATGIEGFDAVVEQADLGAERLAQLLRGHLDTHADERVVAWLHLRDAGERGREAFALLGAVQAALDATDRRYDAVTMFAAFATDRPGDAGFRVPFLVELPSFIEAGRRGPGAASLVDVAGLLVDLFEVPAPDPHEGEHEAQSRAEFRFLLRGGNVTSTVWLDDGEQLVMRAGALRVTAPSRADVHADELFVEVSLKVQADTGFLPAAPHRAAGGRTHFEKEHALASSNASAAEPAGPVPGWADVPGWSAVAQR